MREVVLELLCDLDDKEVHERGLQMSSISARTDEIEAQKKDANKDFAEELSSLRAELRRLSGVYRSRTERRSVRCVVEFHSPVQGAKRVTRLDTGDHVRDEPMTPFEMQDNLFEPHAEERVTFAAQPEDEELVAQHPLNLPAEDVEADPTATPNGIDR